MRPKVLLIEDDGSVAASLKKGLEAEGYDTATAARGDEGVVQATQGNFDVVITDLKLPGLSGLDVVGQLCKLKPMLPVILITAFGTIQSSAEANRLGVFACLQKPFEMTELLGLVSEAVGGQA
jgi:DNA-binding NtrC family response regulator